MPIYFGPKEEAAVEAYNNAITFAEKEAIFNDILHPALTKLAECVLHRRTYQYFIAKYGDAVAQKMLLTFMVETLAKFVKGRGKAFSFLTYCGRNFCIQENDAAYTEHLKLTPIEIETHGNTDGIHGPEFHLPEPLIIREEPGDIDMKEFLQLCADYWEQRKKSVCKKPRHHVVLTELIKLMRDPDAVQYKVDGIGLGKREVLKHFKDTISLNTSQIRPFLRSITSKQSELLKEYVETGRVDSDLR